MPLRCLSVLFGLFLALAASAQSIPRDGAGFTKYVAELLRKELGEPVIIKGPLTLGVGDLQANLDRVYDFCKRDAVGCAAELDRYAQAVRQAKENVAAPVQKANVRVVIRAADYVQAALATNGGKRNALQPRPFVAGLLVAVPVVDGPRTIRMLGEDDNTQLHMSADEVYELGLANLRATLQPLMEIAKVAGPGEIQEVGGDSYDPSRLLLHDTWAPLANAQGGKLIVAIPSTDEVLYIGADKPAAIEELRQVAKSIQARSAGPLSNVILRWTESGWTVVK